MTDSKKYIKKTPKKAVNQKLITSDSNDEQKIKKNKFDSKTYQIKGVVTSSRISQPLFEICFEVDSSVNEYDFAKLIQEAVSAARESEKYREIQKNNYYKFRKLGVPYSEIYPQIERRWAMMDKKERDTFRSKMRQDYSRRERKKRGDKTS